MLGGSILGGMMLGGMLVYGSVAPQPQPGPGSIRKPQQVKQKAPLVVVGKCSVRFQVPRIAARGDVRIPPELEAERRQLQQERETDEALLMLLGVLK